MRPSPGSRRSITSPSATRSYRHSSPPDATASHAAASTARARGARSRRSALAHERRSQIQLPPHGEHRRDCEVVGERVGVDAAGRNEPRLGETSRDARRNAGPPSVEAGKTFTAVQPSRERVPDLGGRRDAGEERQPGARRTRATTSSSVAGRDREGRAGARGRCACSTVAPCRRRRSCRRRRPHGDRGRRSVGAERDLDGVRPPASSAGRGRRRPRVVDGDHRQHARPSERIRSTRRSSAEPPAVDGKDDAVHVVGRGDARKTNAPAMSSGSAHRPAGMRTRICSLRDSVVAERLRVVGRDVPGRDGVDVDAARRPLVRERLRQAGDPADLLAA